MRYAFADIEQRWQAYWAEHATFATPNPGDDGFDDDKPKFYVLDMFPYPSGVGLHVGHPLGYIATDIVARYKRMRGFNVLHPMGYDAFGLPAEQFAVEHGVHPRITTQKNIENMTRQLKRLGLSYDWDRCLATTEPEYYKWTQWVFLQLYHAWFDPAQNKARPISELEQMLESEQLYVGLDDELIESPAEGLDAIEGAPVGARKWHELSPQQERQVLDRYRLAYLDEVPVNWCPALGTVLANEEVTNEGRSERGNHPVFKRPLKQWMLRITAFAERLVDDLDLVDWPEPIKLMQRNWVGKSEGAMVDFAIDGADEVIRVYTTRPDTLFGATYMVLAPEHSLVEQITTDAHRGSVEDYQRQAEQRSDVDRMAETKTKTGVFTGAFAINPVNNERIPIWIADYVLMGYGTGAIMAVPAHDQRDFEFAKQFNLPIRTVVRSSDWPDTPACFFEAAEQYMGHARFLEAWRVYPAQDDLSLRLKTSLRTVPGASDHDFHVEQLPNGEIMLLLSSAFDEYDLDVQSDVIDLQSAMEDDGVCVNSENDERVLTGLSTDEAKRHITVWLEDKDLGKAAVQYKLRDWLFSRQRYWGEPFPILHAPDGQIVPVDETELPVELPEMEDFKPHAGDDPNAAVQTPLSRAPDQWKHVERDGKRYVRELNTMPQWAGSCWYYLRFLDPQNDQRFVGAEAEQYWMLSTKRSGGTHAGGVDLYVGGAEHAVLHLLYARFWHKVLYDLGHVTTPEPFGRLFNQGYIQAYAYTDQRGAYVPAEQVEQRDGQHYYDGQPVRQEFGKMGKSLKNAVTPDEICEQFGCDTMRLYEMYMGPLAQSKIWNTRDIMGVHRFLQRLWRNFTNEDSGDLLVTDDPPGDELRRLLHRTIKRVSDDMERMSFNTAIAALIELNNELVSHDRVPRQVAEPMLLLLSPMAPHIAEELWRRLGHDKSLAYEPWPAYDESLLVEETIELPVQINGKVRGRITVPADADHAAIEAAARADDRVSEQLAGKTVRKVIVVRGRLVNVVAN